MSSKKDESESKPAAKDSAAKGGADAGQAEVQETLDQAEDTGVIGEPVDKTPNENYTIQGVTSGAPTPESDPDAAAEAGSTKFKQASKNAEQSDKESKK